MIPRADAAGGQGFEGYYQGQHAGRDALDHLGTGLVPRADAACGQGFDGNS